MREVLDTPRYCMKIVFDVFDLAGGYFTSDANFVKSVTFAVKV